MTTLTAESSTDAFRLVAFGVFWLVLLPTIRNRVAKSRGLPKQSSRDTLRGGQLPKEPAEETKPYVLDGKARTLAVGYLVLINAVVIVAIAIAIGFWASRHW